MTLPSRIMRLRLVPSYPVSVEGGTAASVTKSGGVATLALDYAKQAVTSGISDPATATVLVLRSSGEYERARLDQLVFPAAGQRTGRGDADYTILTTDRVVALTASLTAPRTWTLPAAADVAGGTAVDVIDEAGGIGSTNTLTITRAASDTINGATTTVLSIARSGVRLISDGISKWTINLIGTAQIADAAVTTAKVADLSVTTGKLADKAVTLAKQADVATGVIMGRATAGTGVQEALTPAQARTVIGSASTTDTGVVELATAAEVATGTDAVRAITPATAGSHQSAAKAWFNLNGSGTIAARDSFNISSFTDIGTGRYTGTFSAALANANYSMPGSGYGAVLTGQDSATPNTASVAKVETLVSNTGSAFDSAYISISVLGDV